MPAAEQFETDGTRSSRWALLAGPIAALLVWLLSRLPAAEMSGKAGMTAAIGALMAVWWMTEAVPLAVTSLLPLALFPMLTGMNMKEVARPYADPNIFLFMGGFLIALSIERWNLHRRIALLTVLAVGTRPNSIVWGVMLATGLISMWISNTASAAMMLPIGFSLVRLLADRIADSSTAGGDQRDFKNFSTVMMLGIAYAATLGGFGTLMGTPTNLTLVTLARDNGIEVNFRSWMMMGVPLSLTLLVITWAFLVYVKFPVRMKSIPGGRELVQEELRRLGNFSAPEAIVITVFTLTALAWIFRVPLTKVEPLVAVLPQLKNIDDTVIAMCGALLLFMIPAPGRRGEMILNWETARKLPWDVLLLFGGGFSLAEAMHQGGLTIWIGARVETLQWMPTWLLVLAVAAIVTYASELTSNTPTAAALLPVFYAVAKGIGIDPMLLLLTATLASSCGFMLPVATPPNAIAFSTGYVSIRDMIKAGFWLDIISIVIVAIATYTLGVAVFEIRLERSF